MRFSSFSIQVFLLLVAGLFQPALRADVFITEFMADNDSLLADEDGDFPDWIELYNSGTDSVDLEGWYLSDDPEALALWRFPALVLDAGDFALVFASG
ncbi:MAG: lamin tail domain-containing protein, partial [Planctomycetota bacterium]|nr:lamin tail domain-containing protein [Planctomycetota bacterium]